jgi:hypothetical protein
MTLGAAIPPKNYQGSASVSWNSPLFEADAMLWKPDDIALVKHRRDIRLIANTPERFLHTRLAAPDCRPARNSRVSLSDLAAVRLGPARTCALILGTGGNATQRGPAHSTDALEWHAAFSPFHG